MSDSEVRHTAVDQTAAPYPMTRGRRRSRRSLTLVENSLHPVKEIVGVPGVDAVPPLVQPTAGH